MSHLVNLDVEVISKEELNEDILQELSDIFYAGDHWEQKYETPDWAYVYYFGANDSSIISGLEEAQLDMFRAKIKERYPELKIGLKVIITWLEEAPVTEMQDSIYDEIEEGE